MANLKLIGNTLLTATTESIDTADVSNRLLVQGCKAVLLPTLNQLWLFASPVIITGACIPVGLAYFCDIAAMLGCIGWTLNHPMLIAFACATALIAIIHIVLQRPTSPVAGIVARRIIAGVQNEVWIRIFSSVDFEADSDRPDRTGADCQLPVPVFVWPTFPWPAFVVTALFDQRVVARNNRLIDFRKWFRMVPGQGVLLDRSLGRATMQALRDLLSFCHSPLVTAF